MWDQRLHLPSHTNHIGNAAVLPKAIAPEVPSEMKSTEVQTSPMLASGAKLLPCGIYAG